MDYPTHSLRNFNSVLQDNNSIYRLLSRRLKVPECTSWILYSLRTEEAPLTQTRLCQLLFQSKQTVNSALKSMEADGIITLSPGKDRRTRVITLTEKGLALAARTADRIIEVEEAALSGLAPGELEAFLQAYRKLNRLMRQSVVNMKETISEEL